MTEDRSFEDRIHEYLDAAERALIDVAPQVSEAVLLWARIDAAKGLLIAFLFLGAGLYAAYWTIRTWRWGVKKFKEGGDDIFYIIIAMLATVFSAALIVPPLVSAILDPFRWIGLFHPEIWLLHKAIGAVS